jgi:hypothetical protein
MLSAVGSPYKVTAQYIATGSFANSAGILDGDQVVNPRPATWSTNPNSKTFGSADPIPVTSGAALPPGPGTGFLAADLVTATYARGPGENASPPTYHITATLSATPPEALGNYAITNNGAEFTILKADQTIAFAALPNKTFGDPDFAVSATATSTLAVTFAASGACTISGTTVHMVSAGSCTITASQAGNGNYNPAPNVAQSFTIFLKFTSLTAGPSVLYPADRRMAAVTLGTAVAGAVGAVSCAIQPPVTFNTPLRGGGPDVVMTGGLTLSLRAERPTTTVSRQYTITVQCVDAASNAALKQVVISVGLPPGRTFTAVGGPDVLLVPACDTCAWTAVSRSSWISITSGASGVGNGQVAYTVARNTTGATRTSGLLIAGQGVTITQSGDNNPPGSSDTPFGSLDTPATGATGVSGSIAVSGWALDDVEVTRVRIYRDPMSPEPAGATVFLGDAVLIEGARPDIERAYGAWPLARRAGWGYLLLTNMLPNQGNGVYTLHAYAEDGEGHATLLGSRTFTAANASATRPFGGLDTPAQGETIAGRAYVNFGWVLTPRPKAIAADGSTIQVHIDGAPIGAVSYNQYRADIATLFPGLANSVGPAGYRVIDTTRYANGLHTISWAVTDSAGATEGIGSRYFTIQNGATLLGDPGTGIPSDAGADLQSLDSGNRDVASTSTATREIRLRRGYDETSAFEPLTRGDDGAFLVWSEAFDRLALDLGAGAVLVGDRPVGASFDEVRGLFTWQPGPGFLGDHELIFARGDDLIVVRVVFGPQEYDASAHADPQRVRFYAGRGDRDPG